MIRRDRCDICCICGVCDDISRSRGGGFHVGGRGSRGVYGLSVNRSGYYSGGKSFGCANGSVGWGSR